MLLAEIPKGVDRNNEFKQQLQLWESGQINSLIGLVLGQQNSGPLRRTTERTEPQTDEQRGKRACNSPRLHQQSHEGIGRRCCAGFSGLPQELDQSPHPAKLDHRNSSLQRGVCRNGPNRLGWRAIETGAERDEGAKSKQNRYCVAAPRQTVAK